VFHPRTRPEAARAAPGLAIARRLLVRYHGDSLPEPEKERPRKTGDEGEERESGPRRRLLGAELPRAGLEHKQGDETRRRADQRLDSHCRPERTEIVQLDEAIPNAKGPAACRSQRPGASRNHIAFQMPSRPLS